MGNYQTKVQKKKSRDIKRFVKESLRRMQFSISENGTKFV